MGEVRAEEAPGPQAVQRFVGSLQDMNGVDARVAAILQRLHAEGRLNAASIVSALREARTRTPDEDDGQD